MHYNTKPMLIVPNSSYVQLIISDAGPRTHPLTVSSDVNRPTVTSSQLTQAATRDGTYQGLYQTIPEVRQNGAEYERVRPEGIQGELNEVPYANTRQYENTRLA